MTGPAPTLTSTSADEATRRTGDHIAIDGAYQYRALHEGNAVQRFWHLNKQLSIARYLPPGRGEFIIDAGCGSGVVSDFLAGRGATVVGIDANADAVAFARRTFPRDGLSFEVGLVDDPLHFERPAQKIYCMEMLEHIYVDQARAVLKVFHAGLAPGGQVFLTTPNDRSAWPAIEWVIDSLKLAPTLAGDQHVARYTPRSLAGLCEEAGFVVERVATTCLVAPWLAPLSWSLALRADEAEAGSNLGAIVVCVARKGGA